MALRVGTSYLPNRKEMLYTPSLIHHSPTSLVYIYPCMLCSIPSLPHTLNGVWIFRHLDSVFPRLTQVIAPPTKVVLILSAETDHVVSIYTPVSSLPIHIE